MSSSMTTYESYFSAAEVPIESIEETISSSMDNTSSDMDNVGAAIGLVVLAGGATAIGAAVVYVPSLVNMANSKTLAISLGLSAGVMIFISFIEIFGKSQSSFEEAGYADEVAYALAMVTFFSGAILMLISHYVLEKLLGNHHHDAAASLDAPNSKGSPGIANALGDSSNDGCTMDTSTSISMSMQKKDTKKKNKKKQIKRSSSSMATSETAIIEEQYNDGDNDPSSLDLDPMDAGDWGNMMLPCCDDNEEENHDPRAQLTNLQKMAKEMKEYEQKKQDRKGCIEMGIPEEAVDVHETFEGIKEEQEAREKNDKLMRMSVKTAFAIALHNFPEGLATFVAALGDPKMGLVLAIGISLHNIPEGLAVALPMYYATGNRHKAFLCGALSGCTEILAALLGWAVLASAFSATMYAVVFGIVSGMMVIISIRELLPTAHQYDPQDKYVTLSFVVGMVAIALSLAVIALC